MYVKWKNVAEDFNPQQPLRKGDFDQIFKRAMYMWACWRFKWFR